MTPPKTQTKNLTLYEQLMALPENVVGEIVDGELYVSPRPAPKHALAMTSLTEEIAGPFFKGTGGGPGGWWILSEPEIHVADHVLVPDLAGWRKERMPKFPEGAFIDITPDWVCEILSPSNARLDRTKKVFTYAALGVKHLWLVDPSDKTLVTYELESGSWKLVGSYVGNDLVRARPFDAIEWRLGTLWPETPVEPPPSAEAKKE
jgi:Uma2 family endonuclease